MNDVVALDVSMGKSYLVVYNANQFCERTGEIFHTRTGFQELKTLLMDLTTTSGEPPAIVFEATGVYSRPLERFLEDCQYKYCLLNPLEAKMQTASMRMHKTDQSDAHRLAQSHFHAARRITENTPHLLRQLKALSRFYEELDEELGILRNRMHKVIQLSFPELEKLFTSRSELFLNVVPLYPHPDFVKDRSKTVIRNRLLENTSKRLGSKVAEKKGSQLKKAAEDSYPAVNAQDVVCEQLRAYAKRYRDLLQQKQATIDQMKELAQEREEYEILISFPGIGVNTAVRLLAEIGDFHRFNNHKQLNAYAGIDIRRYQSGQLFYKDKINKRGNKHLRKLLYLIIQNMIKQRRFGENHFVEYYDKLKTQPYNKCHKVASIACVNKLLKCLFYLITHHQRYDYQATITAS